jgi:hypothetical protein
MSAVKGGQNRFAALPARDVRLVQVSHLKQLFELAPRSHLAEAVVEKVNEVLAEHEGSSGSTRLSPGQLLLEIEGERVPVPLLTPHWSRKLADGFKPSAVRRHLEYEQLSACLLYDESFDFERLWRWTDQKELAGKRGGKEFLPIEPLNVESLDLSPRPLEDVTLPDDLLKPVSVYLAEEYGCKPALAKAMAQKAAQVRQWCCPKTQELKPGQVVWLAYSTRRLKRGQGRLLVPVVLTLLTLDEQNMGFQTRGELKNLKVRQIERLTAEAWRQDGVLTMLDLELLLNLNGATLRQLLAAYQEHFGVLLPTAGTVLDMGRTLTHKTIVVEMSLEGLSTQQIARRIFHTPEAVDNYLRLFDRVLVLRYFKMPPKLMRQVTGHSLALINEHLALAEKHFPSEKDLVEYLTNRGVELEKAQ